MNNLDEQDDEKIILKVLDGDSNAFRFILNKYQAYVFKIVSNNIPYDKVEEIAHEVFIKVYKSLSNYEFKSDFKCWVSTIAVRTCYDYWRKNSKIKELPISSLKDDKQDEFIDALQMNEADSKYQQQMTQKEAQDFLNWAMNHLSAEDRMVLSLVHLEGYSIEESSKMLGWSNSKVKVRAHRSRLKLRELILESQVKEGVKQ